MNPMASKASQSTVPQRVPRKTIWRGIFHASSLSVLHGLRLGPWIALLLLPVEGLLLCFSGEIQVVGPNAFRLPFADWLVTFGVHQPQATHIAGVAFDIKKWLTYFCFCYQLLNVRSLVKDIHHNVWKESRDKALTTIRDVFRWRGINDWLLGITALAFVLGAYVNNFWLVSAGGHVWGPVGKGLLGSAWPYFCGSERWFLIGYRAIYITVLLPLFVLTAATFPGYLRLLRSSSLDPEIRNERDWTKAMGAIDITIAVPLLGLLVIGILSAMSNWLGAGGLSGIAGHSAALAVVFLVLWLFAGAKRLATVNLPSEGSIIRRWQIVRRLKWVISALVGIGLFFLVLFVWKVTAGGEKAVGIGVNVEAIVVERAGEYAESHLGVARKLRSHSYTAAENLLASISTGRSDLEILGNTKEENERTLAVIVIARTLLIDLSRSDSVVMNTIKKAAKWAISTDEWAYNVNIQNAMALLEPLKKYVTDTLKEMPRDYDAVYLRLRRRVMVYDILKGFNDAKQPLPVIGANAKDNENILSSVIRERCRRICDELIDTVLHTREAVLCGQFLCPVLKQSERMILAMWLPSLNNDALRRSHFFNNSGMKLGLAEVIEFAPCRA
ncbi:MAG: hypothetical protein HY033_10450 [Ignavibacteriae bacterium]|nr:hypothetical protein [Ignavibacteria bacterium]MBI3365317.1 hypothetical protein [Ignavibacteriota bacterium]